MQQLLRKETDQALILGLSGEIIMDVVADMKAEIEQLADCSPGKSVVLDLGGVTFMASEVSARARMGASAGLTLL